MFIGQYDHSIDDKSRLTLPARFRDALADGVVLSKGLDGSVDVYPKGAAEDTPDKQGRVLRPAHVVRYGSLVKDVTVIGTHDHLEIWDRSTWVERLEGIEGSAEHAAERLAAQRV